MVCVQGQYDAFGAGGIGAGAGADKRSPSFDPGYGFQSSNLGTGYNQPQVCLAPSLCMLALRAHLMTSFLAN